MDHSPLALLPSELRIAIYEYVLCPATPIFPFRTRRTPHRATSRKWQVSLTGHDDRRRPRLPRYTLAITQLCLFMREEAWSVFVSANVWCIHEADCEDLPSFLDILGGFRPPSSRDIRTLFRHVDTEFGFPGPEDPGPEEGTDSPDEHGREKASTTAYRSFRKTADYFDTGKTEIIMVVRGVRMPFSSQEINKRFNVGCSHQTEFRVELGEDVAEKVDAYVEIGSRTVKAIEAKLEDGKVDDGDWLWAKWEWDCLCKFLRGLVQAANKYERLDARVLV